MVAPGAGHTLLAVLLFLTLNVVHVVHGQNNPTRENIPNYSWKGQSWTLAAVGDEQIQRLEDARDGVYLIRLAQGRQNCSVDARGA